MKSESNNTVEFDDGSVASNSHSNKTSKIEMLVVKYSDGIIKNEKQANIVLFVFVVVVIVLSLFLIFGSTSNKLESPSLDIINSPQPQEGYIPQ